MVQAAASYKKQNGTLALTTNNREVEWKGETSSAADVRLLVADIQNLQQTPETAKKVSIKIIIQRSGAEKPEDFTFTFTSAATARADQNNITSTLRKEIESIRAKKQAPQAAARPEKESHDGAPAALAIAQALGSGVETDGESYADAKLLANTELQRSLLQTNPSLQQRLKQALQEKPDNISAVQFASQFWASRVHLLREHAVSKGQSQGTYNVFSEIKVQYVDDRPVLHLSPQQIQLIFKQHPLIRRVYDENVPPLNENEFWTRFFSSRLYKKLKGEKINPDLNPPDPKLDRYLNISDEADGQKSTGDVSVPHFIDLEGNEQNHSQRKGNKPDWTMTPNNHEKVPILRVLNSISEKMMADVAPADVEAHAPAGLDEETFNQLRLQDLQRESADNRIMLKIKDQKRFHAADAGADAPAEAALYAGQDPRQVIAVLRDQATHMQNSTLEKSGLDLASELSVRDDSSTDDEGASRKKQPRVGSKRGRTTATTQIMNAMRQKRAETDDYSSPPGSFSVVPNSKIGLAPEILEALTLTHATTIEFLHYFWSVFLSGDPDRATEAQNLIRTLNKSLDRINASANLADNARKQYIEKTKAQYEQHYQRTGKKRKVDLRSAPDGAETVKSLMAPTMRAIKSASDACGKAYEKQMEQVQALQEIDR